MTALFPAKLLIGDGHGNFYGTATEGGSGQRYDLRTHCIGKRMEFHCDSKPCRLGNFWHLSQLDAVFLGHHLRHDSLRDSDYNTGAVINLCLGLAEPGPTRCFTR